MYEIMKRLYIKPEIEVTKYACNLMTETMSSKGVKETEGTWDLNAKGRKDSEDYQGLESSSDWSDGLW